MRPILVVGTGSDAGKTSIVMALCRIFSDLGLNVAPFKAQNVSNNSCVTIEGREISRAQYFQAQAARVAPSYLFNPVLLKSHGSGGVQVVVNGLVHKNQGIVDYFDELDTLKSEVKKSFTRLLNEYDLVIAEGAGSPVELNLIEKDLSNTFIAQTFKPRIILVADIERGGVFASIYGTLALLSPNIRENVVGVIINKFRGDRRFFDEGEVIIREQFGVPVLGVLPFLPLNIDMEDSQSLHNYQQRRGNIKIKIAVIATPRLSNYTDLDVLMADDEIEVTLIHQWQPLSAFDVILLAGSKSVISDLITTKPLGNVTIEAYDYQQQKLKQVTTNAEGTAVLETKQKPFVLIAKRGQERTYLKLDDGNSLSLSSFEVDGDIVQKGIKGFIYGERGVWRPGDSLFLSFILENKTKAFPENYPASMELINPQGQVVQKLTRTNHVDGFYNFTTKTESSAPTGVYLAKVKVGGAVFTKNIRIETIMPNRLKINLDYKKDKIYSSDLTLNSDLLSTTVPAILAPIAVSEV